MVETNIGFVIMQIGNSELDHLYENIISKAIEDSGLKPIRIDKHNQGGLLKSEIIENIEKASIIIADLTNERPNCYLEIGYAMGLDKNKNLILTAKEDHFHESPKYKKSGPKIHFDLSGYDILFWYPDKLDTFQKELTQKIQRRLLRISTPTIKLNSNKWNEEWLSEKREYVSGKLKTLGFRGSMEVRATPLNNHMLISQSEILEKAKESFIENFGWPIGILLTNIKQKPIVKTDGVLSEIINDSEGKKSYDYSYYKKDGSFYTSVSHHEDSIGKLNIIVPTRIIRVTEVFMFLAKYYTNLGFSVDEKIEIIIRHNGLAGRNLQPGFHYDLSIDRISNEDEIEERIISKIQEIENDLTDLVSKVMDSLLILFDFYKIDKSAIEGYVNNFITRNI